MGSLQIVILICAFSGFLPHVSSKGIRDHLFFQAWPNLLPSTSGQSTTTSPNPNTPKSATTNTSQTPITTQVVVEDKGLIAGLNGFPPTLQDILNYLLNKIPHWNQNKVENVSDKAGNAGVTSAATSTSSTVRPTTKSSRQTTESSRQTTESSTQSTESSTQTTASSTQTTESSTQTTPSTTAVVTSTSTTTSTSTSTTTSPGNTTGHRPGMLPFPTEEQAQVKDPVSKQLSELLFWSVMRPPITDYKETPRSRSGSAEGNIPFAAETPQQLTPRTETSSRPQTTTEPRPWYVDVKSNGAVFIRNNQQIAAPVRGVVNSDKGGFNYPDVQDKPYYGTNLAQYFTEPAASSGVFGSAGKIPFQTRAKRAVTQGVNCQDPSQHQSCGYYPSCFSQMEGKCSDRKSYLGDDAQRFCVRSMEAASKNVSVGSTVVSSYLKAVFQCLNERMSFLLESPTCSEITSTLKGALHYSSRSSCLFLGERFCDVINDDVARPHLIRILYEPCNDEDFMELLLVNSMKLARMCRGPGVGIFTTDAMFLAKDRHSVFRDIFSNAPVPGVQARS